MNHTELENSDSILLSIKQMLGLQDEYDAFDMDIIMHINSVISILNQMGVGEENFKVQDETQTWDEFMTDKHNMEEVKSYIYLKVKLLFDPPLNSAVLQSQKELISELEWRLNVECDDTWEKTDSKGD